MFRKQTTLILWAALLSSPTWAAIDGNVVNEDPVGAPKSILSFEQNPTATTTMSIPTSSVDTTMTTTTKPTSLTSTHASTPSTTTIRGYHSWVDPIGGARDTREAVDRHSSGVMIGGLMILIVGLLGPLVLWCWIRKRRQQEEAEFAAYMAANPPPFPPGTNTRRHEMEMRNVPVYRPASPSGVAPPPTYQEAITSGRIPELPKYT
jgi:hypothetical protein